MDSRDADDDWLTIDVAAKVIGRNRKWIDRAIADHKLSVRRGENARHMRLALVRRADVVRLSEQALGHISDSAIVVGGVDGDSDGDNSDSDSYVKVGSDTGTAISVNGAHQHDIKKTLGWREAAWGLAGIAWQQGREVEHLRGELSQAQQQIGEERGRRLAAEQRAQAAAEEVAALREQAVHIDAARQEPPQSGLFGWRRLLSRRP